jgi:transcriptional regulator with XRE-family HTH domain
MSLGSLLKTRRDALGFTQEQYAGKLGIPLRTYRGWETDEHIPGVGQLRMLARVLGISVVAVLAAIEAAEMAKAEVVADASHLGDRGDL